MKLIRAKRGIHVPVNPEMSENAVMRPVAMGLVALIHDEFTLPEDSYIDLGKVDPDNVKKNNQNKNQQRL
jgi:hypothetical protein